MEGVRHVDGGEDYVQVFDEEDGETDSECVVMVGKKQRLLRMNIQLTGAQLYLS